jgi:putative transcriptional regulator
VKRRLAIAALVLAPAFKVPLAAWAQQAANGIFLVAQPTLNEATFRRTVILITQLPSARPIGVIINRPLKISLRDVLPEHSNIAALPQPVYFGGPVARRNLTFLVRTDVPPPHAVAILNDVYLLSDADWVEGALQSGSVSDVRVFAGYAGWAPGQLQTELQRQGWYMVPAESGIVFDADRETVWEELVRRAVLRPTTY